MTINNAYKLVLAEITKLQNLGIKVETSLLNLNDSKNRCELSSDKWIHTDFKNITKLQKEFILRSKKELRDKGMYFNTEECYTCYKWMIDWSFKIKK